MFLHVIMSNSVAIDVHNFAPSAVMVIVPMVCRILVHHVGLLVLYCVNSCIVGELKSIKLMFH